MTPLHPGALALSDSDAGASLPMGNGETEDQRRTAMRDKVEQLQADIETGVAELVDGEERWLSVAARFPKYRTATRC